MKAYLDIETSFANKVTVIGIYIADSAELIQMVGQAITPGVLLKNLSDVKMLYTYNGHRFDIPVIHEHLGINLRDRHESRDLMHDCWRCNLKGGLKAVEKTLGIPRTIFGKDEDDPRILWQKYRRKDDLEALERLLDYNRQDCINLMLLEESLETGCIGDSLTPAKVESYVRII